MKRDVTLAMDVQVVERILDNATSTVFQGKVRLNKLHAVLMSAAQSTRFSEIVQAPFLRAVLLQDFPFCMCSSGGTVFLPI